MGFEDLDGVHRSIATGEALTHHILTGPMPTKANPDGSESSTAELLVTAEQTDYLQRRATVLRRVLASGDRLVGALGIILNGHDPEEVAAEDGRRRLCCRICHTREASTLDAYPCATVKNALWALEATRPHWV